MSVRSRSLAVEEIAGEWPLIGALMGGTSAMRAAGKAYLPQFPNELNESYQTRLRTATLFPAFSRTVDVLASKPFSRPVTVSEDVPARVREWCADVDLQGRDLHAFAAALFRSGLSYGIAGILVDYPQASGIRTAAEEREAGVRPYFVEIAARCILGWRASRVNGAEVLTQLRLLEKVYEANGDFAEREIEQVRVLTPGAWQTWREDPTATTEDKWRLYAEGATTLRKIPFVPVYGHRTGVMRALPPLSELAHMNVEHWQSKSDQQTILHVARVPILFGRNLGSTQIVVGAASAIVADSEGADLKFVEHSGAAIEAGRVSLLDLEDRMRQVGAELLVVKPGNTSITQTIADNEPGMCALQRMVRDHRIALGAALGLMAEWIGERPAGHVEIFNDFGVSSLAEASLSLLREMTAAGQFSAESLFHEAKRRGVIQADLNWPDERDRIAAERRAHEAAEKDDADED